MEEQPTCQCLFSLTRLVKTFQHTTPLLETPTDSMTVSPQFRSYNWWFISTCWIGRISSLHLTCCFASTTETHRKSNFRKIYSDQFLLVEPRIDIFSRCNVNSTFSSELNRTDHGSTILLYCVDRDHQGETRSPYFARVSLFQGQSTLIWQWDSETKGSHFGICEVYHLDIMLLVGYFSRGTTFLIPDAWFAGWY